MATPRYTTALQVSKELNAELEGTLTDDLNRWIVSAEQEIDRHCGRFFDLRAETHFVVAVRNAREKLWLPDMAEAPTLVEMRAGLGDDYEAITDYEVLPPGEDGFPFECLVRPAGWQPRDCRQRHVPTVRVTAKPGWAEVPGDINSAARLLTLRLQQRFQRPILEMGLNLLGDPDVKRQITPYVKSLVW